MRLIEVLFCLSLVGCASTGPSDPATLRSELAAKRDASQREFPRPPDDVLRAAQAVLNTMSDDYEYSANESGLSVTRRVYYFGGLQTISYRDYWSLRVTPSEGSRTVLMVSARLVDNSGILAVPVDREFLSDIPLEARDGLTVNQVRLFLDRVEYALSLRETWPTCAEIGNLQDRLDAVLVCSGVGLDEHTPAPRIGLSG